MYDSLRNKKVSEDLSRQLHALYSPDGASLSIEYIHVQQQQGSSDCGLFCIAFAVDVLLGNDVQSIQYDQSQLREHLASCIKSENFTAFPRKRYRAEADKLIRVDGDWRSPNKSLRRRTVEAESSVTISNSFEILAGLAEEAEGAGVEEAEEAEEAEEVEEAVENDDGKEVEGKSVFELAKVSRINSGVETGRSREEIEILMSEKRRKKLNE